MKIAGKGKRFGLDLGILFIGVALVAAVLVLPGAKGAASPALYVIIVGGLFVGIPLACGIGIVTEHLLDRHKSSRSKLPSNKVK